MIVSVRKSKTTKNGSDYEKTEFCLETETNDLNPDLTKTVLEAKIDGWLNEKNASTSTPVNTTKPNLEEKGSLNTCERCHRPVKGTFKLCYPCHLLKMKQ